MRERSLFNFEHEIEGLQYRIQLARAHINSEATLSNAEEVPQHVTTQSYIFLKEEENRIKKESTYAAAFETRECMLFAFCQSTPIESKLSIQAIKKTTGKSESTTLKKLDVQVSCLAFGLDEYDGINLLVSTLCGRLFIYSNFEEDALAIHSIKISSNAITRMLFLSFRNWVFVVNKAGTIYLLNFKQNRIYYQFRCSLPMIDDPSPRLITDLSETYIGHAFSFGRIILWEITSDIKNTLRRSQGEETKTSHDNEDHQAIHKCYEEGRCNKQNKQFILRYKMSIVSSFVKGITWCDFLGTFIVAIDYEGEMRVLAININQSNESHEFFTVISRHQVYKQRTTGKSQEKQTIVDAVRLRQSDGIIVGKNVNVLNCGKKVSSKCYLQRYAFDQNFQVSRTMVISLCQINQMDQFLLNSNMEYLMVRNSSEYSLVRDRNRKLN